MEHVKNTSETHYRSNFIQQRRNDENCILVFVILIIETTGFSTTSSVLNLVRFCNLIFRCALNTSVNSNTCIISLEMKSQQNYISYSEK